MKYEIDIEGLPAGWKAVAYRIGVPGVEHTVDDDMIIRLCQKTMTFPVLIVEKIQPRRIVLEETGEFRKAVKGEFCEDENGLIFSTQYDLSSREYKIWREVK